MVALTDYWYYGQVERILLHTCRLFMNFQISIDKDSDGMDILKRVPCMPAFNDKTVASMITGNSDVFPQSAPKMIVQLKNIHLDSDRQMGEAYQHYQTSITERQYNEAIGNYDDEIGSSYEITRLNPIPLGLTVDLHILTTMYSHKMQLFEQIRPLFTPTLELQVSENPLDWNRICSITLTNLEFSSRSSNLNSAELDDMVMTFKINTNLDFPAEISRIKSIIQEVNTSINSGIMSEFGWNFDESNKIGSTYTPTGSTIKVSNNDTITLYDAYGINSNKSWKEIFDLYKLNNKKVQIALLTTKNILNRNQDIIGDVEFGDFPNKLKFIIDKNTLPSSTVENIDDIIDPMVQFPHNHLPEALDGQRYLIISDISSNTTAWGIIKDESGNITHAKENQIIEYRDGNWVIVYDPLLNDVSIVRCMADDLFKNIYMYDKSSKTWVDYINRYYKEGYFRILSN